MNLQEENEIKLRLYKEFYENNKQLFKDNKGEFLHYQRVYVEQGLNKI